MPKKSLSQRLHDTITETGSVLLVNSPGMRTVKTAIAVAVCLLVDQYRGANLYDAAIAAIVCLGNDVRSTARSAFDRTMGTLFAGIYTIAFLWFFRIKLGLGINTALYHILIGVFAIPLMHAIVKLKRPGAVVNGVIVFLLVCVGETALEDPVLYVFTRVTNTIVGILIALVVNWLPPLNNFEDWFNKMKKKAAHDLKRRRRN